MYNIFHVCIFLLVHQFVHSDLDEPITLSQSLIKTLTHSVIDKDAITQHLKYIIDILSGIRVS